MHLCGTLDIRLPCLYAAFAMCFTVYYHINIVLEVPDMLTTPPDSGTVDLLIEMFDEAPVKNLAATLALAPKRVVYLGGNHKQMERSIAVYEPLCRARGMQTEFSAVSVPRDNLKQLREKLLELLQGMACCVVDITGGHEMAFIAMGQLMSTPEGMKVTCVSSNIRRREVFAIFGAEWEKALPIPILTVEEQVQLCGGKVQGMARAGETWIRQHLETYLPIASKAMLVCRDYRTHWNGTISTLGGYIEADSLDVFISANAANQEQEALWQQKSIFKRLAKDGLIHGYKQDSKGIYFSFPSVLEKELLSKSGNVLETMVFLALQAQRTRKHLPVFTDVKGGVVICWNGECEEGGATSICNEVDVVGMAGLIPYFVSCKNGKVGEVELYKLSTVAEEFGGAYGCKLLVMGDVEDNPAARQALMHRAKEMNIKIIEGVQGMTFEKLKLAIKSAIS